MSKNGIAWLPTKEARQVAKLNLAASKRGESYDRDLLPTKYDGNDTINNPNIGGLQHHRPWTTEPLPPTYQVVPRNTSVNEGGNITVDIYTTNFPDGLIYFTVSGVLASDIQSGILPSGDTTVNSGVSAVSFNTAADLTTEGVETLVFELRTGSTSGPIVATANITINDTSTAPTTQTYTVRQHLYGYNPLNGSNSGLYVLDADYPLASTIPTGATATINGTPTTVTNNSSSSSVYFNGGTGRSIDINPSVGNISAGTSITFSWTA